MPLYEYECDNCGNRFEQIQKFSDPLVETCTKCGGGPVHKLMSSPAIQFKGSGWYITDYAKKREDTKAGSTDAKDAKGTKADTDSKGAKDTKDSKPASTDAPAKTETAAPAATSKEKST